MSEEYIRDFHGNILGIIRTKDNGDKEALDFPSRQILGEYLKERDQTIAFPSRQVINKGDTVVSFIYKKKGK